MAVEAKEAAVLEVADLAAVGMEAGKELTLQEAKEEQATKATKAKRATEGPQARARMVHAPCNQPPSSQW